MAKTNYSNSVRGSLNGRGSNQAVNESVEEKVSTVRTSNNETSASKAGRKSIDPKNKRKQITLTLDPKTIDKLEKCDNFRRTLNRYIDKNIDNIVKELNKL